MEPALIYRAKQHPQDTEDIAYEFIEQEVGRLDWKNNWPKFKANHEGTLVNRIQRWLDYIGIEYDPKEIIKFLDDMVAGRNGKWR
jgi:hypothetical protein